MSNTVSSVAAIGKEETGYQTGFVRWRAAEDGFGGWSLDGVIVNTSGELQFASTTGDADPYAPGAYNGGNYYNGSSFLVGEATSPAITTGFNVTEAIASWNTFTPPGSWVEIQLRARYGTRWSRWYVLGIWAADDSTIRRHSVQSQGDSDGFVAVDTFVSTNQKETSDGFQLKLRLFSVDGTAVPVVQNASVAYSTTPPKNASVTSGASAPASLSLPRYSQYAYPHGGEVWCSPVSVSMVLAYLDSYDGLPEPRVLAAVEGVYDRVYQGHGNWPFNTAYAARDGVYEAYVARFTSLKSAEAFLAAGIPVIMSIAWNKGVLTNSGVASTNGHLLVMVGSDSEGNPIVNDPANDPSAPQDSPVQRVYLRQEFEPLWLQASGGAVYLIYPAGKAVPPIP
jgi:hypothetical protein